MSRVPQSVVDPNDPQSVVEHLYRVQRVVDGRLEFGSPQDPGDPASLLGTGQFHNGTILNILGSWVEELVALTNTTFSCTHNLGVPVTQIGAVNQPNVRWLVFGFRHPGTAADAASTLSVSYDENDAAGITENAFPLRLYAAGARTVAAPNDFVTVTMFFVPAVR